ncbi:MAG: hypothetical protein RRC07_06245 [Anaerolineae bacterium]|nr:hypothetical protein [Anaerolineae bacterium]
MSFPTIFDWLERLAFLQGMPAAAVIVAAGAILTVLWDWRVTIFALLLQYLASSFLYVEVLEPRLAIVKLFVGVFICLILYFTARQTAWGQAPADLSEAETAQLQEERRVGFGQYLTPASVPFRFLFALLVVVVLVSLSGRPGYQLPAVPPSLNLAIYALVGFGVVNAGLTAEPLRRGTGLLLILSGAELFYNTLEQSIVMLAVLAGANLMVALAVSYLTQLQLALPVASD